MYATIAPAIPTPTRVTQTGMEQVMRVIAVPLTQTMIVMETPSVVLPDLLDRTIIVFPNQTWIRPIQTMTGWEMPVTIVPITSTRTRKIDILRRRTSLVTA